MAAANDQPLRDAQNKLNDHFDRVRTDKTSDVSVPPSHKPAQTPNSVGRPGHANDR
jgi:hypothetical protein